MISIKPIFILLFAAACAGAVGSEALTGAALQDALLNAAKVYPDYKRVDPLARFAPLACAPIPAKAASISTSSDAGTHGKKLYYLYAKDQASYIAAAELKEQPVGQLLVKESYHPAEKNDGDPDAARMPGEKFALFVMLKTDPKTPETDNGWVYATLTPDGKTITQSGRIASCMKCHEEATHDRLFGLPKRRGQ
jgi:hypothetical protein